MNHNLFIMQGAPGCGKSTFIKNNNLNDLVISPDELRMIINPNPIVYNASNDRMEHGYDFTSKTSRLAFEMANNIMTERMRKGCDIILDLTAANRKTINKLLHTAYEFNYNVNYVNMQAGLALDVINKRNHNRGIRAVPDDIVHKMYDNVNNYAYTDGENVITPDEMLSMMYITVDDIDGKYDGVRIIGDVQGSWARFHKSGFDTSVILNPNILHVITGDINDRGEAPDKMFDWVIDNIDRDNLIIIRGNHDNYWRYYGNQNMLGYAGGRATKDSMNLIHSKSKHAHGDWHVMRKIAMQTERKFTDFKAIRNHGVIYVMTHGGLEPRFLHNAYNANMNAFNLGFMSSEDFYYGSGTIIGSGDYKIDIDRMIEDYNDDSIIQIHGHRNNYNYKPDAFKHVFNLEQRVEYDDGALADITINNDNSITTRLVK